jgi:hypothetical protein
MKEQTHWYGRHSSAPTTHHPSQARGRVTRRGGGGVARWVGTLGSPGGGAKRRLQSPAGEQDGAAQAPTLSNHASWAPFIGTTYEITRKDGKPIEETNP